MAAVEQDIEIEQGATWNLGFVYHHPVLDSDGVVQVDSEGNPLPGPPYNLTGCTARMQIKQRVSDTDAIITATSQPYEDFPDRGGRIILEAGGVKGRIDIVLTDADTDMFTVKRGRYDLELEWPLVAGEIRAQVDRLLEGAVANTLNVTKVVS